jgi:hypothetical protein
MRPPTRRLLTIAGLLATVGTSDLAHASTSPAAACAASQLKAMGKLASASFACHAATASKQHPPQPCITDAITAFETAWATAEAKGGCTTTATTSDVESEVSGVVGMAVGELTGTPEDARLATPAAQACAARKLKATGTDGKAQLGCAAAGAKDATLFTSMCVEHAGAALLKAWDKAEAKGGCATQGDSEVLNVNGLLVWGVTHLGAPITPVTCGTFVTTWAAEQGNPAADPRGVAVDGSGNVFVTDELGQNVEKFTNAGSFLTGWSTATPNGSIPVGVAVDGSGNVYVADAQAHRIDKFDNSGAFLTAWGSDGTGNGQFSYASDVAVDGSGHVFVADGNTAVIQKFDNNGTFLLAWGTNGQVNFANIGVAVDGSGHVFVANTTVIQKFDNNGNFLTEWGGAGTAGGEFNVAEGVAVDGSGNVFVADPGNSRVQVFTNTGTFLTAWGSHGDGPGQFGGGILEGGADIAVDGSGNVFVIDLSDQRIEKFACPVVPQPATVCGVISGDPAGGNAICGGPCPLDFPFCAWVQGTQTGACRCVDNPCGSDPTACGGGLCAAQNQTCATLMSGGCGCQ